MKDRLKNPAVESPLETEQAVADLAERLEEMDKAEGVFGESMSEALPEESLGEIAGGAILPVTLDCIQKLKKIYNTVSTSERKAF